MEEKFNLKIVGREGVLYNQNILSVSSYNEKGKFDILGFHSNFISLVNKALIIKESKDIAAKEIKFDSALLRTKEGKVEVYIGIEGIFSAGNQAYIEDFAEIK